MKKNEKKVAEGLLKQTEKRTRRDAKTAKRATKTATEAVVASQEADRKVSLIKRLSDAGNTVTGHRLVVGLLFLAVAAVAWAGWRMLPNLAITPEEAALAAQSDNEARQAIAARLLGVSVEELKIRMGPAEDVESGIDDLREKEAETYGQLRENFPALAMMDPPDEGAWYKPWTW